jgi:hypothetical protein
MIRNIAHALVALVFLLGAYATVEDALGPPPIVWSQK